MLAVALGLVTAMTMSSLIAGLTISSVNDSIRGNTGHIQIRSANFEEGEQSLLAEDLLRDGDAIAQRVEALPEVISAAPVLMSGGLLSTAQESFGVTLVGINPDDAFHALIRDGIVAGEYLQPGQRGSILVGRILADEMGITPGQRVSLASSSGGGDGTEGLFTVAGLFESGYPSIDYHRVILPLEQAQSFSGVGDRVSSVILMLDNQEQAETVAAALQSPETQVKTWQEMNSLIVTSIEAGVAVYNVFYGIIFVMVAVLITNTLLMSVFERTREIGILSSLGMNRRQLMLLFLIEAVILAILGIAVGLVLGMGAVSYLTFVGFTIPAETAAIAEGFTLGTSMRGAIVPGQIAVLSLLLLLIVSIVSLYPAWFAARMEPVEALHAY